MKTDSRDPTPKREDDIPFIIKDRGKELPDAKGKDLLANLLIPDLGTVF